MLERPSRLDVEDDAGIVRRDAPPSTRRSAVPAPLVLPVQGARDAVRWMVPAARLLAVGSVLRVEDERLERAPLAEGRDVDVRPRESVFERSDEVEGKLRGLIVRVGRLKLDELDDVVGRRVVPAVRPRLMLDEENERLGVVDRVERVVNAGRLGDRTDRVLVLRDGDREEVDRDVLGRLTDRDVLGRLTERDVLGRLTDRDGEDRDVLGRLTDRDVLGRLTDRDGADRLTERDGEDRPPPLRRICASRQGEESIPIPTAITPTVSLLISFPSILMLPPRRNVPPAD